MPPDSEFKSVIKQYIDERISRRIFLGAMTGMGLSAASAGAVAREFAPFVTRQEDPATEDFPAWMKHVRGNGGKLLVEQIKAAGYKYLFVNPSSGEAPIFDALIDEPDIHIIKSIHEGALVAMADGYAKASGETPFVLISRTGLPNAMSMMFNSWKDYVPMLVLTDDVSIGMAGQDGFQAMDQMTSMTQTMTKWHWSIGATDKIPEVTRRALKFASTRPCRPVFLSVPANLLSEQADAAIMEQGKFNVPMTLRADAADIALAAELLLNAKNPLILTGDEVRYCQAQPELLELAELLGIPVVKEWTSSWSKTFPTKHPLYLGNYRSKSRYPGKVDVMLNLGSRMPIARPNLQIESHVKLIQVRLDAENLARVYPTELAIIADLKLALTDLIEQVKKQSSSRDLKRAASDRLDRAREYQAGKNAAYQEIARKKWDNDPISAERLMMELENTLEKDSVIVSDNDSYMWAIDNYLSYGPDDKDYYFNTGFALGWGLPAAFGVKLAMPDRPVVAIVSDGSFLFSGPQPLWTYSRYKAPIIVIVMNNRSYNNERNRIMTRRGRSYETGRDLVCYLGDPDVDYVKLAAGFDVEGEIVSKPEQIIPSVQRAMQAIAEDRPYLLDVLVERTGNLANSTWHPEFVISSLRKT